MACFSVLLHLLLPTCRKESWCVIRRPLLSTGHQRGSFWWQTSLGGTADTCAAQVGCCSLDVLEQVTWNDLAGTHWPLTLAPSQCCSSFSLPGNMRQSPQHTKESPGWLRGLLAKTLNLQNLSGSAFLFLIHITWMGLFSWRLFPAGKRRAAVVWDLTQSWDA